MTSRDQKPNEEQVEAATRWLLDTYTESVEFKELSLAQLLATREAAAFRRGQGEANDKLANINAHYEAGLRTGQLRQARYDAALEGAKRMESAMTACLEDGGPYKTPDRVAREVAEGD